MKKDKNSNFSICVWLGIISFILFCGVIIFAAYLYKFNPLSMFSDIFHLDKSIGWNALEALGTICIGVVTIWLSSKVSKFQENQANIQNMQNMLYIEPHILVDSFVLLSAECELNNEKTEIKSLKGIDYPFFIGRKCTPHRHLRRGGPPDPASAAAESPDRPGHRPSYPAG